MVQAPAVLIALLSLAVFATGGDAMDGSRLLHSPYGDLFGDAALPPRPVGNDTRKGGEIVAGIVPHHGLAIGVIERFYERIASSGQIIRRVWLFAPDHFRRSRADLSTATADWETNARVLEADLAGTSALIGTGIARDEPFLFEREHGVTIHIPAIAHYFPTARVVPIVLHWRATDQALRLIEKAISRAHRPGDLFVLSMDFSHGKSPLEAAKEDERSLAAIASFDRLAARRCDIDAGTACALLLKLTKSLGARSAELLERTDSAALGGEPAALCTSYAAMLLRK